MAVEFLFPWCPRVSLLGQDLPKIYGQGTKRHCAELTSFLVIEPENMES